MNYRPKVFFIIPFEEDFLILYEELKKEFEKDYDFFHAGDLDNQRNILQDIVDGIYQADVIVADLTGLNPNVFYELGLAHAMNKKVIIITQKIDELPFDIRSYRANEYSLKFYEIKVLFEKLDKMLKGAVDNTISYGNPVTDYIPDFYSKEIKTQNIKNDALKMTNDEETLSVNEEEGGGFLDHIEEIKENTRFITQEIKEMSSELNEMNDSVRLSTEEINRTKKQNGMVEESFARNVCRKLSEPVDDYANKLKVHVQKINGYWHNVENSYLQLLDNPYLKRKENIEQIRNSMRSLQIMRETLQNTDDKIEGFIGATRGYIGIERRLSRALSHLAKELEEYMLMTGTMNSSIDRILGKGEIVIRELETIENAIEQNDIF